MLIPVSWRPTVPRSILCDDRWARSRSAAVQRGQACHSRRKRHEFLIFSDFIQLNMHSWFCSRSRQQILVNFTHWAFKRVCGEGGAEAWAEWRPSLHNVTMKRGKWPSKWVAVTIRVARPPLLHSVIAHLTGSCRRGDGQAPLLESATVMRWPPITARPLFSQLLAFLVKEIAVFLP